MALPERFDYNLIKTLVLVYETKSMGKAAAALGVSSPTLTYSLNKIRDYYGDQLFIKTAHGLKVTAVAKQLYPLFKSIDEDINSATSLGVGGKYDVRTVLIRTSTIVEHAIMDGFLKHTDAFSDVVFDFNNTSIPDEQRVNSLIARETDIDIGLAIRSENSLVCTPLFKSNLVALCNYNHPRLTDELTQEQWLTEEHAIFTIKTNNTFWPAVFNELLAQRKIRYRTTSLLNAFRCLELSEMIMIVPEFYVKYIFDKFALRSVKLPWLPNDLLEIFAYTHSKNRDDGRIKSIIHSILRFS